MGKTLAEKILARAAGREEVAAGELVTAAPDMAVLCDAMWPLIGPEFHATGATRVWDPERVMMVIDHSVPGAHAGDAALHREVRDFCREQGITRFYDIGEQGISHQVAGERGLARPGMLYTGDDGHATTLGAFGALAIPLSTEMVAVLVKGKHWFRVPETWRIALTGELAPGVVARDVVQKIMGDIGLEGAAYRALEFVGPAAAAFSIGDRMTFCSLIPAVGAETAWFPPDEVTFGYLSDRTTEPYEPVWSDPDADFERELAYDLGEIEPQVAAPPHAYSAHPVAELRDQRIGEASIGSCAGSRIEDLRAAASVLRGHRVARGVRFSITPASHEVYTEAAREGLLTVFAEAGAVVGAAGCMPCFGYTGQLQSGETCIATHTVNYWGRMGAIDAAIYLASAATVAASAVEGHIADPRPYLEMSAPSARAA